MFFNVNKTPVFPQKQHLCVFVCVL